MAPLAAICFTTRSVLFLFSFWRDCSATAGRTFTKSSSRRLRLLFVNAGTAMEIAPSPGKKLGAQKSKRPFCCQINVCMYVCIFEAKIQTLPSSDGFCAEMRRNSGIGKTKTTWLDLTKTTTISRLLYDATVSATQRPAVAYLIDCVTSASDIASRQRLRSASRQQLLVPRYQLSSLGRRSFAVAGPTTWNSLSADLWRVFQTFIENILVR